jgi:hypothetical protein
VTGVYVGFSMGMVRRRDCQDGGMRSAGRALEGENCFES